jgi:hypothetical protein
MGRAGLVPLDGVDEVGIAGAADVEILADGWERVDTRNEIRDLVEVDHLDRLAGRKDDAADVVAVVGFAAHAHDLLATSSAASARAFMGDGRQVIPGALPLMPLSVPSMQVHPQPAVEAANGR